MANANTPLKYLILGDGRVARHFTNYLSLLNLPHFQWKNSRELTEEFFDQGRMCSHLLILTSDSAIDSIAQTIKHQLKEDCPALLHCSGALVSESAVSVHPLFPFPLEMLSLDKLQSIPFIMEDRGFKFEELLPKLNNPHFSLPSTDKPLYHAYCVMLGNFTTLLWQSIVQKMSSELRIPKEFTYQYLMQVLSNFLKDPDHALTGPLVRGDSVTLEKNLKALHEQKNLEQLYRDFVHLYFESPRKDNFS